MAIQHRRGDYSKFNSGRMVDGEIAVILSGDPVDSDGKGVYMAFAPGKAKRIAFSEDVNKAKNDAIATSKQYADGANQSATDAKNSASAAATSASQAKKNAEEAANSATTIINENLQEKVDAAKSAAASAATSEKNATSSAAAAAQSATDAAGYAGAALYSIGINPDTGHMAIFYNKETS